MLTRTEGNMDTRWNKTLLLAAVSLLVVFPAAVLSDPLSIDFNQCQDAISQTNPADPSTRVSLQCCPVQSATPAISGFPPPLSNTIRVRLAAQCTDAAYAQKLDLAYTLMKQLPPDDPRSFEQQWKLHCSYCGTAFYILDPATNQNKTIDVHFSWLFYPWHRWYLYFHERILQSLLGDPTFSLSYYNWDNPFDHPATEGSCSTVGHNFPSAYSSQTSAAYNPNRSASALGTGGFNFPDLTYLPVAPPSGQKNANLTREELIYSNLAVLSNNLVTGATTGETFMGKPYVLGAIGTPNPTNPLGGGGPLEAGAHASVHSWIGKEFPDNNDMGVLAFSARDPIFFSHHSNIDRLWQVWKDIGPVLGQDRQYYNDPDFLSSTFLFYDENKALWSVNISDSLDTTKLGYTYQPGYIEPWLDYRASNCSSLGYNDTITRAQGLPAPIRDAYGNYHLEANSGCPFILLVTQPERGEAELFLTIDGICFNRSVDTGFDVYINWLDPQDSNQTASCREYAGRFFNMASSQGQVGPTDIGQGVWTRSISTVLEAVGVPPGESPVAVTIVPLPSVMADVISFTSISISASSS